MFHSLKMVTDDVLCIQSRVVGTADYHGQDVVSV